MEYKQLIKKAHQEAHECNASKEVHDWIDWFEGKIESQKVICPKCSFELEKKISGEHDQFRCPSCHGLIIYETKIRVEG